MPKKQIAIFKQIFLFSLVEILSGDINGDDTIDLTDAILANKNAAGIDPGQNIFIGAGINNDGKIGIEESIYILETLTGMREFKFLKNLGKLSFN